MEISQFRITDSKRLITLKKRWDSECILSNFSFLELNYLPFLEKYLFFFTLKLVTNKEFGFVVSWEK